VNSGTIFRALCECLSAWRCVVNSLSILSSAAGVLVVYYAPSLAVGWVLIGNGLAVFPLTQYLVWRGERDFARLLTEWRIAEMETQPRGETSR
jgi:hypothetical protein